MRTAIGGISKRYCLLLCPQGGAQIKMELELTIAVNSRVFATRVLPMLPVLGGYVLMTR
jgi:hypothetical protein